VGLGFGYIPTLIEVFFTSLRVFAISTLNLRAYVVAVPLIIFVNKG
jgi:hypothetical protein